MPGSLSLPQFPTCISKLGIYCRLQFPIDFADFSATTFLQASWGQRVDLGGFGDEVTAQAKRETVALGLPLASVILKGIIVPMPFPSPVAWSLS
jgi:hypothetical protein